MTGLGSFWFCFLKVLVLPNTWYSGGHIAEAQKTLGELIRILAATISLSSYASVPGFSGMYFVREN